jgi:RNA-binding protein
MSRTLTGAERALKSQAQLLEAVVRVGQAGVSAAVVSSLDVALGRHGLVKVRFADFKEEQQTLAPPTSRGHPKFSGAAGWKCRRIFPPQGNVKAQAERGDAR